MVFVRLKDLLRVNNFSITSEGESERTLEADQLTSSYSTDLAVRNVRGWRVGEWVVFTKIQDQIESDQQANTVLNMFIRNLHLLMSVKANACLTVV